MISPGSQIYELDSISSFQWVNQITGYSQGSKINTTSYINTYDQCYDMSTNGPDVLKIHENWSFYSSYETNYLPRIEKNDHLLEDMVKFVTGNGLKYTKN